MARRSENWNTGLAHDLRDPEFAQECLLASNCCSLRVCRSISRCPSGKAVCCGESDR